MLRNEAHFSVRREIAMKRVEQGTRDAGRAHGRETQAALAPRIEIGPLWTPEDAVAFRTLNEEWITRYFSVEEKDRETLGDPNKTILGKGGHIFMVRADGEPVGCVALIPMGKGVYELSKMAVSPGLRGLGIGRRLIEYAIGQAKAIGASSLFLGSSTKLKNAVHLYEAVGFCHVPPESLPEMKYARADVFMEMVL
jgi:putative acetyltransferase